MSSILRTATLRAAQAGGLMVFAALLVVAAELASSAVTVKSAAWESCEPGIARWSLAFHNPLEPFVSWEEQP